MADYFSGFKKPFRFVSVAATYDFRICNSYDREVDDYVWLDCDGEGRYFILCKRERGNLVVTELEVYAGRVSSLITLYVVGFFMNDQNLIDMEVSWFCTIRGYLIFHSFSRITCSNALSKWKRVLKIFTSYLNFIILGPTVLESYYRSEYSCVIDQCLVCKCVCLFGCLSVSPSLIL